MTGKELYKIYAPFDAEWTNWVRPVPFVAIDTYNRQPIKIWTDRKAMFLKDYQEDSAIFVDLPGSESIEFGIALAHIGYRPIPIFNGVDEEQSSQSTTENSLVEEALIVGAEKLKGIKLANDAMPVFLLDSARLNCKTKRAIFDNSWDLYGQDIPPVDFFKQNGVKKIIVLSNKVQRDLRKIFFKFQDNGFELYLTDGYITPKKIRLKKSIKEYFEKEEL